MFGLARLSSLLRSAVIRRARYEQQNKFWSSYRRHFREIRPLGDG